MSADLQESDCALAQRLMPLGMAEGPLRHGCAGKPAVARLGA